MSVMKYQKSAGELELSGILSGNWIGGYLAYQGMGRLLGRFIKEFDINPGATEVNKSLLKKV